MDKKYLKLMMDYNKNVNENMNNIIKTLSENDWNKYFSGYYKSLHELCSHLFIGDYTWLGRFRTLKKFKILSEYYFNKNLSFHKILFENIPE